MMNRCSNCKFFDGSRGERDTGWCRLEPPKVIPVNNRNTMDDEITKPFTAWPLVRAIDWCGEWMKRTEEVAVGGS